MIRVIELLGATIDWDVSLPHTSYALAVYYLLAPSEASANLARYDGVKYGYSAEAATMFEWMDRDAAAGSVRRSSAGLCSAPTLFQPATTTPIT